MMIAFFSFTCVLPVLSLFPPSLPVLLSLSHPEVAPNVRVTLESCQC